jgi:hypothetical protein
MHGVMAGESNTAQAEIVVDGIMAAAKIVCHLLTVRKQKVSALISSATNKLWTP